MRNSSWKKELQALRTTRWARTVRPSADRVTSVSRDWSNSSGSDDKRLVCKTKNIVHFNLRIINNSIIPNIVVRKLSETESGLIQSFDVFEKYSDSQ